MNPELKELLSAGINKYLDISTGHISKHDDTLLKAIVIGEREMDNIMMVVHGHPYGYLVYVSSDLSDDQMNYPKHLTDAGFSEEFVNLLKYANELGCTYLCLDCDGLKYEGLPEFNW